MCSFVWNVDKISAAISVKLHIRKYLVSIVKPSIDGKINSDCQVLQILPNFTAILIGGWCRDQDVVNKKRFKTPAPAYSVVKLQTSLSYTFSVSLPLTHTHKHTHIRSKSYESVLFHDQVVSFRSLSGE